MFKFLSAWEKSLPDLCAPKSENSNFQLLVPNTEGMKTSVQLTLRYFNSRKAEQSKKDLLLRNSTSFIAYWKTVCEYARGIRYMVASFRSKF